MKIHLLLIGFFFLNSSFSQDHNWTLQQTIKGVEIYVNTEDCIKPENGTAIQYIYIKVVNTTDEKIILSFDKELWYDNKCSTCDNTNGEHSVKVLLESKEELSGNCENNDHTLEIFSKMLNLEKVRKLSKYELKNIQIEKLN